MILSLAHTGRPGVLGYDLRCQLAPPQSNKLPSVVHDGGNGKGETGTKSVGSRVPNTRTLGSGVERKRGGRLDGTRAPCFSNPENEISVPQVTSATRQHAVDSALIINTSRNDQICSVSQGDCVKLLGSREFISIVASLSRLRSPSLASPSYRASDDET
jgi:hypothetical protein